MRSNEQEREGWKEVVETLRSHGAESGVVLGSGLGEAATAFSVVSRIAYAEIPGLPRSTVAGHAGELLLARAAGVPVVLARGRVHLYEGRSPREVGAMMRLLADGGVRQVVLTNAAGGLRPDLGPGMWMMLTDHVNLTTRSPLEGAPAFVDMQGAYDAGLRHRLREVAGGLGIHLHEGIYAAVRGPQYETPAEVRMLRVLGVDAVGMSTVLECIQARGLGLRVAGISLITNYASGVSDAPVGHEEVLAWGREAGGKLGRWLAEWLTGSVDG